MRGCGRSCDTGSIPADPPTMRSIKARDSSTNTGLKDSLDSCSNVVVSSVHNI